MEMKAENCAKNSHCQREKETGKASETRVYQIKSGLCKRRLIVPCAHTRGAGGPTLPTLSPIFCGLHLAVGPTVNHLTCSLGEQERKKEKRQKERKSSSMNRIL